MPDKKEQKYTIIRKITGRKLVEGGGGVQNGGSFI
jgi:hypothetical protein